MTTLTVGYLRSLYENLASSPDTFVSELNQISYRLMNADLWEGISDEVLFPASEETRIVLPRQYVAVLGYDFNGVPQSTWGQFHQYIEKGIGWVDPDQMTMRGLIGESDVPSQLPISGTATLRVKISLLVDVGKTIRFYGLDANGERIYTNPLGMDGIDLVTASPSADTTQTFTVLTNIQCQTDLVGPWTLWQVVSGTETQIGSYLPGDTSPMFRSYKLGLRTTEDTIRCFLRRQWMKVVAETDLVYPDCQSAYKLGFKALQLEDANKYNPASPNADDQWERSENELQKQIAKRRGSELPSLKIFGGPYPRFNTIVN